MRNEMESASGGNKQPVVYMLCGLTGSGKTTYTKKHLSNIKRLSIDELIFNYHGDYGVDYPEEDYPKFYPSAESELKEELIRLLQKKESVVLDYGFWTKKQRDSYKKLIEENWGEWKLLYFRVPAETLLERLDERNRRNDANALTVTKEALNDFINRFEEPVSEGEIIVE